MPDDLGKIEVLTITVKYNRITKKVLCKRFKSGAEK